jgi:hypothetical protein
MENSDWLPAAEVRIDDLITLWDGTGYRVREVTPSASCKIIEIRAVVEAVVPGGAEFGRPFNLGQRAGTMLMVERGGRAAIGDIAP